MGSQAKVDKDMQELAKTIPVWPTADVMTLMGAKDALVKIKDTDFGLVDTLGYYSPEDMKAGFPKAIAFQPRVVKQNRGSAGEGIWIIKLKDEKYCENYGEATAPGDAMLVLKEANDDHIEEYTVDELMGAKDALVKIKDTEFIKLKNEKYCENDGNVAVSGDEMLVLKKANENRIEEFTVMSSFL